MSRYHLIATPGSKVEGQETRFFPALFSVFPNLMDYPHCLIRMVLFRQL